MPAELASQALARRESTQRFIKSCGSGVAPESVTVSMLGNEKRVAL